MPNDPADVIGGGTILRGNFAPSGGNNPDLKIEENEKSAEIRDIEEFESAARERIGGSIAFVTRLKDQKKDALMWDGDEE